MADAWRTSHGDCGTGKCQIHIAHPHIHQDLHHPRFRIFSPIPRLPPARSMVPTVISVSRFASYYAARSFSTVDFKAIPRRIACCLLRKRIRPTPGMGRLWHHLRRTLVADLAPLVCQRAHIQSQLPVRGRSLLRFFPRHWSFHHAAPNLRATSQQARQAQVRRYPR